MISINRLVSIVEMTKFTLRLTKKVDYKNFSECFIYLFKIKDFIVLYNSDLIKSVELFINSTYKDLAETIKILLLNYKEIEETKLQEIILNILKVKKDNF